MILGLIAYGPFVMEGLKMKLSEICTPSLGWGIWQ